MYYLALFVFLCVSLGATERPDRYVSEDKAIVLSKEEVFSGTYFAVGESIELSGRVEGDVYLVGTQIVLDGVVEGDVIAIGGSIDISGQVRGNVKLLAGQVFLIGDIGGNALILTADVRAAAKTSIAGNAVILAGNADLEDKIGGNATVLASSLKVAGTIERNLSAYVGRLRISSKAHIVGDVKYRSNEAAFIDPGAEIGGKILYKSSLLRDLLNMPILRGLIIGSKVAGFLMNFFYTFVIGLLLIRMFPRKLARTLHALEKHPFRCLLYGVILMILIPAVSVVLLVTVIGAPFALTLMALNILGLYTMKLFVIMEGANWFFSKMGWRKNTAKALLSGQIVYCIVTLIPGVGFFVSLPATLFGLGATVLSSPGRVGFFRFRL